MSYLVWRRGLRGPNASIDRMDPRSMISWAQIAPTIITIIPLAEHEREMHLDTLMALHPCPEVDA